MSLTSPALAGGWILYPCATWELDEIPPVFVAHLKFSFSGPFSLTAQSTLKTASLLDMLKRERGATHGSGTGMDKKGWGGGSGWGTHVNPWLIHVNVWQKPLQYCKVISLQLIKINGKKIDKTWWSKGSWLVDGCQRETKLPLSKEVMEGLETNLKTVPKYSCLS